MFNRKQKIILTAAALAAALSAVPAAMPYANTAYASWQAADFAAEGQVTKDAVVAQAVSLYEMLSGKSAGGDVYRAAEKLGIITAEELAHLGDGTAVSKQDAARLLYHAVMAYDSTFALSESEIDAILSRSYDNVYIDSPNRAAMAFLIKYGAVASDTRANPYAALPQTVAEQMTNDIYDEFTAKDSVTVGAHTVHIGEGVHGVLAELGVPNRIEPSEYGFDWYVYNADYENFLMVGIQNGKVCAFFSNAEHMDYHNIRTAADITEPLSAQLLWAQDGTLDAVYYNPEQASADRTDQMRRGEQTRMLDIINAYRTKKDLPLLIENSAMTAVAEAYSFGERYNADTRSVYMTADAADILDFYENTVLAGTYPEIFDGLVKHNCYTGLGIAYTDTGITAALIADPNTTIKGERQTTAASMDGHAVQTAAVTEQTVPQIVTPGNEQVYEYGADVTVSLAEAAANRYLVQMMNIETGEYAVNAYITAANTEMIFPAELFEDGADYMLTVSAADGDTLLTGDAVTVVYGYCRPPVILSPVPNSILSSPNVTVSWQSDLYSDFRLELYRDGAVVCDTRVSGAYSTQLMDLQPGSYMLGVSVLRKNTNIIKNTSWIRFDISELPIAYETQYITREDGTVQEVRVPKAAPASKAHFTSDKYARIFGGPQVYTSKEQADANMQTVEIPVWKMKNDGAKYSSAMTLTVNSSIAADVVSIFTEIYNGPEQFPIKSAGGYSWRDTATGTTSQHSYGTCIDINPDENYCIYRSGRQIGSFWKPYDNPYSITPDGDVVRAFAKYGWTWGADWNSLKDYMHFSYLGG